MTMTLDMRSISYVNDVSSLSVIAKAKKHPDYFENEVQK